MDYTELIVTIAGDTDSGRDITIAELSEAGFESFEETESGLKAYIRCDKFDEKKLEGLLVLNKRSYKGSVIAHSRIMTRNWNEEWEKYYEPVSVGEFCHIRASFHSSPGGFKHEIVIQPKMSFGTGHHETTWLVINALQKTGFSGKEVLDMGCGTGVLAILSSKMGAKKVTAVDIDEWAVKNTKENAEVNRVTGLVILEGDISVLDPAASYDIIFANITRNVLAEYIPIFSGIMKEGGLLFTSGFYLEDLGDIINYSEKAGLGFVFSDTKNRWTMAQFRK